MSESTPPPPPPPNLTPPPGFVAYQPTNWDSSPPARPRDREVDLGAAGHQRGDVAGLASRRAERARRRQGIPEHDGANNSVFNDSVALWGISGLVTGAAAIVLVVLSIIWLFRVSSNHRTLGRALTWVPGWAIGGWFLPPLLYIIPLLVLREAWKAANPATPAGSQTWKSEGGENPWIWLWFLSYSIAPLIIAAAGASSLNVGNDTDTVAKRFAEHFGAIMAQSATVVVAAVMWLLVVHQLTQRHARFTGEASAR